MKELDSRGWELKTALALSVALLQGCGREGFWEKTLAGPFLGEVYQGELPAAVVSSLPLEGRFVLEARQSSHMQNPVLCLREPSGKCVWARLLVPRLPSQKEGAAQILDIKLDKVKATGDGFKVLLSCNWTGGGKEGGVIYLAKDFAFRNFALGW